MGIIRLWIYSVFKWLRAMRERAIDAYYGWKLKGLTYGDILWMRESGGLSRDPVQAGYVPKEVLSERWLRSKSLEWLRRNGFCVCCGVAQPVAKGWCDICHEGF